MCAEAIDPNLFQEFKGQSLDLLAQMRDLHERLKRDVSDLALVREFYRHMHTVKGNAMLFGFRSFAELAHALETVLDAAWKGRISVAHDVLVALERGISILDELLRRVSADRVDIPLDDQARSFLDYLRESFGEDDSPETRYRQLLNRLAWLTDRMVHPDGTLDEGVMAGMVALVRQSRGEAPADAPAGGPARPGPDKPSQPTVRYLFKGVDVTEPVERIQEALGRDCDPEDPEGDLDIAGELEAAAGEIRTLLSDDAAMNEALDKLLEETLTVAGSGLEIDDTLRGLLVETLDEFVKVLDIHRDHPDSRAEVTVRMVRIQEARLREMVGLLEQVAGLAQRLGELVGKLPMDMRAPVNVMELIGCQAELDHNVAQLCAGLNGLGREPLGRLFGQLDKLVQDVADRLQKTVEVQLEVAEQTVSRHLVEELEGPIVHLVRNAVDHGLESTDDRLAAGKPATGCLVVGARIDADNLVVVIRDDGRGIDTARVRTTALARGLVTPQQVKMMSTAEIQRLILEPTFSTAAQLTDLSGRGIGLDLVNAAVVGLGGSLELGSAVGEGTTFRLTVPLDRRKREDEPAADQRRRQSA